MLQPLSVIRRHGPPLCSVGLTHRTVPIEHTELGGESAPPAHPPEQLKRLSLRLMRVYQCQVRLVEEPLLPCQTRPLTSPSGMSGSQRHLSESNTFRSKRSSSGARRACADSDGFDRRCKTGSPMRSSPPSADRPHSTFGERTGQYPGPAMEQAGGRCAYSGRLSSAASLGPGLQSPWPSTARQRPLQPNLRTPPRDTLDTTPGGAQHPRAQRGARCSSPGRSARLRRGSRARLLRTPMAPEKEGWIRLAAPLLRRSLPQNFRRAQRWGSLRGRGRGARGALSMVTGEQLNRALLELEQEAGHLGVPGSADSGRKGGSGALRLCDSVYKERTKPTNASSLPRGNAKRVKAAVLSKLVSRTPWRSKSCSSAPAASTTTWSSSTA